MRMASEMKNTSNWDYTHCMTVVSLEMSDEPYLKLLPLQGVTNERALTQGVASLALGYVLLPFQGVHY